MKNHLVSVDGNLCDINSINVGVFSANSTIANFSRVCDTCTEYQTIPRHADEWKSKPDLSAACKVLLGLQHLHCSATPFGFPISQ